MSEDVKKPSEEQAKPTELTENELQQATGGAVSSGTVSTASADWGDIKGGSRDDKHKDWSEIVG